VLKGTASASAEAVVQDIRDLCTFMEECLTNWLDHIRFVRKESYYLNYFTTEQLVILQNELAKVNSPEKAVPWTVYPLLSGIRKNCTLKDLERAMRAAFQQLARKTKSSALKNTAELPGLTEAVETETDSSAPQRRSQEFEECWQALIDSGYSEKLAELAIKTVGASKEEGNDQCVFLFLDGLN
jgi:hypothetical protein